jgi:hypothetical protein
MRRHGLMVSKPQSENGKTAVTLARARLLLSLSLTGPVMPDVTIYVAVNAE